MQRREPLLTRTADRAQAGYRIASWRRQPHELSRSDRRSELGHQRAVETTHLQANVGHDRQFVKAVAVVIVRFHRKQTRHRQRRQLDRVGDIRAQQAVRVHGNANHHVKAAHVAQIVGAVPVLLRHSDQLRTGQVGPQRQPERPAQRQSGVGASIGRQRTDVVHRVARRRRQRRNLKQHRRSSRQNQLVAGDKHRIRIPELRQLALYHATERPRIKRAFRPMAGCAGHLHGGQRRLRCRGNGCASQQRNLETQLETHSARYCRQPAPRVRKIRFSSGPAAKNARHAVDFSPPVRA